MEKIINTFDKLRYYLQPAPLKPEKKLNKDVMVDWFMKVQNIRVRACKEGDMTTFKRALGIEQRLAQRLNSYYDYVNFLTPNNK